MAVQQLLSFNDLSGLGSSPAAVRQKFADTYGKNPDGICVNSETYYNAVSPAITQQYGLPCYMNLGDMQYSTPIRQAPTTAVAGSQYVTNQSDQPATMTVSLEGTWQEQTEVSSSVTTGMSFTTEFTVEGVFSTGAEFNVSTTAGKSTTTSLSRTANTSIQVDVPPRSKKQVSMIATLVKETLTFKAPVVVQGSFGANFPDRVNGHYFWFMDSGQLLTTTNGQINGTVTNTSAMHTDTLVGPAESL